MTISAVSSYPCRSWIGVEVMGFISRADDIQPGGISIIIVTKGTVRFLRGRYVTKRAVETGKFCFIVMRVMDNMVIIDQAGGRIK